MQEIEPTPSVIKTLNAFHIHPDLPGLRIFLSSITLLLSSSAIMSGFDQRFGDSFLLVITVFDNEVYILYWSAIDYFSKEAEFEVIHWKECTHCFLCCFFQDRSQHRYYHNIMATNRCLYLAITHRNTIMTWSFCDFSEGQLWLISIWWFDLKRSELIMLLYSLIQHELSVFSRRFS